MRRNEPAHPRGFSLIETLMASAIMGLTLTALVGPFSLAEQHQKLEMVRVTAGGLATEMMERLITKDYDTVVGMNGTSETGAGITGADGVALGESSFAGYTRTVSAVEEEIRLAGQGVGEGATFCRVTVRVSHTGIDDVVLVRLFSLD